MILEGHYSVPQNFCKHGESAEDEFKGGMHSVCRHLAFPGWSAGVCTHVQMKTDFGST